MERALGEANAGGVLRHPARLRRAARGAARAALGRGGSRRLAGGRAAHGRRQRALRGIDGRPTAAPAIEDLCERLRVPNPYRELAVLSARLEAWHRWRRRHRCGRPARAARERRCLSPAGALRAIGARVLRPAPSIRPRSSCCSDAAVVARGVALSSERMQGLQGVEIAAAAARGADRARLQALSERAAQVLKREPAQGRIEAARERHDLEALTHLPRQQQAARLRGQPRARHDIGGRGAPRPRCRWPAETPPECSSLRLRSCASTAASATRVKSTQAVTSCTPGNSRGSSCARWRKWQRSVPRSRCGW